MDCRRAIAIVFATVFAGCFLPSLAAAQREGGARMAYNPVSGRTERDSRFHQRQPRPFYKADDVQYYAPDQGVQPASYCECGSPECGGCDLAVPYDDSCCDDYCGDACGCGDVLCSDSVCGGPCLPGGGWYAGFEATFVKPHFSNNVAFSVTDNTATSTSITETDFDYDLEFTPRVFVGWNRGNDVGLRATWWQFDHGAKTASGSPPANGLGEINPPEFGDVDLSSTTPTDVFAADTSLNAYTIDLEATKSTKFCAWQFGMGCGFRYAYAEQGYVATLADDTPDTLASINYQHSIEGFGPTVSFEAYRPYNCRSGIFCKARGSILFGDSKSRLVAGEDLTLTTPFETTETTASDDLLSICELQVGYRWYAAPVSCRAWQPFGSIAMEGQVWDGAGNATSQEGTLGFFGFNTAIGVNW
jgi:hypothetical protein